MAEGRGESSYEQRGRVVLPRPAQGRAGPIQRASLPSFPLSSLMPFVPLAVFQIGTNGVQLCCQSIRNSTRPTVQGEGFGCKRVRLMAHCVCPHPDAAHLLMCRPPNVFCSFFLLTSPECQYSLTTACFLFRNRENNCWIMFYVSKVIIFQHCFSLVRISYLTFRFSDHKVLTFI